MKLLHAKILGEGQPLLILHGFLGMSDNWKTLGKKYSEDFQVHLIDQRNHGRSFHDEDFSYEIMARDLNRYIEHHKLTNVILLGHSMGGKTVMQFSTMYPDKIAKMIVADIAPKNYPSHHQDILKALKSIRFNEHQTRKTIEAALSEYISDAGVVQFLMKNVYRREKNIFDYRFNLPVLEKNYENILKSNDTIHVFEKPVLFLRGDLSHYISKEDQPYIVSKFPDAKIETIKEAGHWLHAEQPIDFYNKTLNFIKNIV